MRTNSIRPKSGSRVRYVEYVPDGKGGNTQVERVGTVLTRVEYINRPTPSSPKAYLKVRRDDGHIDRQVDYFQLLGYAD